MAKSPVKIKTIKLALADDHNLFREGFSHIIDEFKDIELIIEANNGKDLIKKIESRQPDVILMDLKMPEMDGLKATAYITQHYPDIKIIALTVYNEKRFIIEMVKMGAHGYLFKNAESNEVEIAIHSVIRKGFYFNEYMTEALYKGWANKKNVKIGIDGGIKITKQELQVLKLICNQFTTAEIAEKMFLSHKTIENYRCRLLQKLNVRNTAGLVIYAFENNLADIDLAKKRNW